VKKLFSVTFNNLKNNPLRFTMPIERIDGKLILTPINAWQWLIAGIVLTAFVVGLAFVWIYVVLPNLWWVWTVILGLIELLLLIGTPAYVILRLIKLGFGLVDSVIISREGIDFQREGLSRDIIRWGNIQRIEVKIDKEGKLNDDTLKIVTRDGHPKELDLSLYSILKTDEIYQAMRGYRTGPILS